MRTDSIREQKPVSVSGNKSLAKPGSMPEVNNEAFPAKHAASSWATSRAACPPVLAEAAF